MKYYRLVIIASIVGTTFAGLWISVNGTDFFQSSTDDIFIKERLLGELGKKEAIWISRGTNLVAWKAKLGKNNHVVVLNGENGPVYDNIGFLTVSADGHHIAYNAKRQKNWYVVVDGKEGKAYQDTSRPIFSADGKHIAYIAKIEKNSWTFVIDGQEIGPKVPGIGILSRPALSPDGKHWGFWYLEKGFYSPEKKFMMIIDGQKTSHQAMVLANARGGHTEFGGQLVFSPDGKRQAFIAYKQTKKGHQLILVVDGVEGPPYDNLWFPTFSPDSTRFAYVGSKKGKVHMIIDGVEGPPFDMTSAPFFSADSTKFAYTGVHKHEKGILLKAFAEGCIVIDGHPEPLYKGAILGNLPFAVMGGKYYKEKELYIIPERAGVSTPVFSQDSRHIAYAARLQAREIALVVDGEVKATAESIGFLQFLSDGSLCYCARMKGKWQIIRNGKPLGGSFDDIGELVLSENGQNFAYCIWHGNLVAVVVNLKEGKTYNTVYKPTVTNDGTARYVARRSEKVFLVEQKAR